MQDMTSNRPYLIRAYYDWIVDNKLTPHLVVDATLQGVVVPQEHVKDGQIVLNISPTACGNLQLGMVDIEFDARFSGVPRHILLPCNAVLAIYARENGAGTMFPKEVPSDSAALAEEPEEITTLTSVEELDSSDIKTDDDPPKRPVKKGKPNLKVIK